MLPHPSLTTATTEHEVLLALKSMQVRNVLKWTQVFSYLQSEGPHASLVVKTLLDWNLEAWTTMLTGYPDSLMIQARLQTAQVALASIQNYLQPLYAPRAFASAGDLSVLTERCVSCEVETRFFVRTILRPVGLQLAPIRYPETSDLYRQADLYTRVSVLCRRCCKPCQSCEALPTNVYNHADLLSRSTTNLCIKCVPMSLSGMAPRQFKLKDLRSIAKKGWTYE